MAKFPLYQWKKAGEGSSSIDTQNFASKIKANTFTQKNTFKNTGDIVSIQRTDNQSFGIDFKREDGERVAYIGTSQNETDKATVWGVEGLILQTTNKDINISPGTGHTLANSSKNWNQHVDNSIVRYKDLRYQRKFEYTQSVVQPTNNWNYDGWKWQLNNINSNSGLYEFLIVFSFADDKAVTIKANIAWKSGLTESQSTMVAVEKSGRTFYFQLAIKNDNRLYIYHKHDNQGTSTNISCVRGYILRDNTFPTKMSSVW